MEIAVAVSLLGALLIWFVIRDIMMVDRVERLELIAQWNTKWFEQATTVMDIQRKEIETLKARRLTMSEAYDELEKLKKGKKVFEKEDLA